MKLRSKSILMKLLLSALVLVPSMGYPAGWTSYYPVEIVYPYSNGKVLISLQPRSSHVNPDGCKSTSWYILEEDSVAKDNIYKLLLTAIASGKRVRLYLSGCGGSYPRILHANIRSN